MQVSQSRRWLGLALSFIVVAGSGSALAKRTTSTRAVRQKAFSNVRNHFLRYMKNYRLFSRIDRLSIESNTPQVFKIDRLGDRTVFYCGIRWQPSYPRTSPPAKEFAAVYKVSVKQKQDKLAARAQVIAANSTSFKGPYSYINESGLKKLYHAWKKELQVTP